jgi:predicted site-specific integrase-resolvase
VARQRRSTSSIQESTHPITQVALYARVSTLNNQDPEMQLSELREYAGRRGWQIVEEFTDQEVSGCKESRPALNLRHHRSCKAIDCVRGCALLCRVVREIWRV